MVPSDFDVRRAISKIIAAILFMMLGLWMIRYSSSMAKWRPQDLVNLDDASNDRFGELIVDGLHSFCMATIAACKTLR